MNMKSWNRKPLITPVEYQRYCSGTSSLDRMRWTTCVLTFSFTVLHINGPFLHRPSCNGNLTLPHLVWMEERVVFFPKERKWWKSKRVGEVIQSSCFFSLCCSFFTALLFWYCKEEVPLEHASNNDVVHRRHLPIVVNRRQLMVPKGLLNRSTLPEKTPSSLWLIT